VRPTGDAALIKNAAGTHCRYASHNHSQGHFICNCSPSDIAAIIFVAVRYSLYISSI